MAQEVTDAKFDNEVLKSSQPVLVDFWAPWCGPCRMMVPVIEKLAKDYEGKAKVVKLNTDDNPNVATQYRVQSIPTLLFFKGGSVVEQLVGVQSENDLRSRLDQLLK